MVDKTLRPNNYQRMRITNLFASPRPEHYNRDDYVGKRTLAKRRSNTAPHDFAYSICRITRAGQIITQALVEKIPVVTPTSKSSRR